MDEKFFFRVKFLLFEIIAEGRSSYKTLDHCIHIAGVANIIKASQLIDLTFFSQLDGVELFEGFVIDNLQILSNS